MSNLSLVKENSPHLRRHDSIERMMIDVLIALAPLVVWSLVIYQLQAFLMFLVSLITMLISEFVFVLLRYKPALSDGKISFKKRMKEALKGYKLNNALTPAISALIMCLCLPSSMPLYGVFVGAFIGIVFGKLAFGGLGHNIFNPAAVAVVVAKICFGSSLTYESTPFFDVVGGGTALGNLTNSISAHLYDYLYQELIFGLMPGSLGETPKILILISLVYLLVRHTIDWRIPLTYFSTFYFLMLFAGVAIYTQVPSINPFDFATREFLMGGLLFGGVLMLTDPVTMPLGSNQRYLYASFAGIIVVLIRLFAALPEGVAFSILLANMIAPALERIPYLSPRFSWKGAITLISSESFALMIVLLGSFFGGLSL